VGISWQSLKLAPFSRFFCENESSLLGVVRSLIFRGSGIQFAMVKCVCGISAERTLEERPSVRLGSFGTRPQFDATTYAAYERAKRDILSSSLGRVALMHGGIVWRLAQNLVKVKAVTRGPNIIQSFSYSTLDGRQLVDDGLPQADEDIICSVYHLRTRKFSYFVKRNTNLLLGHTAGQDTEVSWWPKTNTWSNSGYNVGYWSADCENWYQERLTEIRQGKAELHMASKWRQILKLKNSHTTQFVIGINTMADMLLQQYFRY
jgi:hypothetical protein